MPSRSDNPTTERLGREAAGRRTRSLARRRMGYLGNDDFGAAKIDDRCAASMGSSRKYVAGMRFWLTVLRPALNSSVAAGATSCRADRWFCDQVVCHVIHYLVCNRLDLTRRSVALRPHRRSHRRATLLRQSRCRCTHCRATLRTRLCGVVLLAPCICYARDRHVRATWPRLRREQRVPRTQGSAKGRRWRKRDGQRAWPTPAFGRWRRPWCCAGRCAPRAVRANGPRPHPSHLRIFARTMGAYERYGTNVHQL
jgi:hypothetical protein